MLLCQMVLPAERSDADSGGQPSRWWRRSPKQALIVGSGPIAARLYRRLKAYPSKYHVLGFVDTPSERYNVTPDIRERLLGDLDELETILVTWPADEVLVALPVKSCYSRIQNVIRTCERIGVDVRYLADLFEVSTAKIRLQPHAGLSTVSLATVSRDYRLLIKRLVDILGAATGLILLFPIMVAVACAVKFTSRGPAFYVQQRYGLNRRLFRMYKFRTMVAGAERLQHRLEAMNESGGPLFKIRKDPRITALGRLLRVSSIDELPQLWNVLRGDMSLVGPRPLPVRDVSRFPEPWLMRRFSVKPGLTGLWQIRGRSDAASSQWIKLDLEYIDSWSLALDFSILARTPAAVIRGTGAA